MADEPQSARLFVTNPHLTNYYSTDARPNETCVVPVDASRDFFFSFLRTSSSSSIVGGGGRGCCQTFYILFSFPCSEHQVGDCPPWKVVFSDWQPIR